MTTGCEASPAASYPPPPGPVFLAGVEDGPIRDYRKPTSWLRLAAGVLFLPEGFLFRLIKRTAP